MFSTLRHAFETSRGGRIVNHHGVPTFTRSNREQARNFLRTGTLSGTFYVGRKEMAQDQLLTLTRLAAEDADALADEAVAARNDGYMRTLPVLAAAVLSGTARKDAFRHAVAGTIRIPTDAAQFAELCLSGAVPGRASFGGCAVEPVRQFLEVLSEYHALKYGAKLTNLVRLAHPRPATPEMRERLGWLSGHVEGKRVRLNKRIAAFEALKRTTDEARVIELIRNAGLPYECVVGAVSNPSPAIWAELLRVAPTMNLLRSLVTFTRHGVFQDRDNVRVAAEKLSREGALQKSMIFPHQVYTAWRTYSATPGADESIIAALSDMLDGSVATLPVFQGRTCIAPDVSGSMQSTRLSERSETTAADVAGVFTAGLMRRCPDVRVLPFDQQIHPLALNARDSVLANARKVSEVGGGGTSLSAPVTQLLRDRDRVDTFIGITDYEEWVGHRFLEVWREYRRTVATDATAILITPVPGTHSAVPESEPGVHFVHGWSDAVFRFTAEAAGAKHSIQPESEEDDSN